MTAEKTQGAALVLRDLHLSYPQAGGRADILDIPDFAVPAGAMIGIAGASGSGKTSLLHLIAGIEQPDRGSIAWSGTDIVPLGQSARDRWRRRTVGFVFQDFHLVPGLSALANVLLPSRFERLSAPPKLVARASALLAQVGVPDRPVETLSRGQAQRVAVARALLFAPPILLADEPTASLDADAAHAVADLLVAMAQETGATLIAVSHDPTLLDRMQSVHRLVQGRFI